MRNWFAVLALAVFAGALPLRAAPEAEDRVAGRFTVGDHSAVLDHVRVFREVDPFGRGTNPCLVASNEPLPDDAVPDDDEGIAALLDRMRSGNLRALQICFRVDGRALRSVNDAVVFHPEVSPGRFAFQGFHDFTPTGPGPGRIAGKLVGSGTTPESELPWTDELEFSVALPPEE